jgi:Protein of unknown function (DUF402)
VLPVAPPIAVFRFIRFGKVRHASPHYVVRDDGELVALYLPVGAPAKMPARDGRPIRGQADREWELRDHVWHTSSQLALIRWGRAHAVELLWDGETGDFAGWYVNLQEPLRRSPLGFDTDDLVLDIRVQPDGTWQWKDEDELQEAVRLGRFSEAEARAIRAEGERVLQDRPWPTGWEDGYPDPDWGLPELPGGWDVV